MRNFKILMLITVLSFSFSLNNVSAEEGDFESLHMKYPNAIDKLEEDTGDFEELHKKYPNAVDMLTEGSKKEAEELEQKVLEDMKNNPDKVEYAVPVDVKQDDLRVVTVEEQEMRENNFIDERDYTTVITTEEQNMVENSTVQSGFVKQENGTGFFFEKVK